MPERPTVFGWEYKNDVITPTVALNKQETILYNSIIFRRIRMFNESFDAFQNCLNTI